MKIDLANIAGTPGARGRFSVSEEFSPSEGIPSVGPVTGELTVENTGSLLLIRGRLHATLRLACARCLVEGEQPVDMEVEEEFASVSAGPEVETVDREEPAASALEDFVLDVHELVRQQVSVNLPMTYTCRPDCRGLCPRCGKNLNEGDCGCQQEAGDGRWAKLGDLLGGGEGREK